MTITANKDDITKLLAEEFVKYENKELFSISEVGQEAAKFRIWSAWHPDFDWLESLLTKYPSCWVKDIWIVEDGQAGVWIGTERKGEKEIRQFLWDDMCIEEEAHRFRKD